MKPCRQCKEDFEPQYNTTQPTCSPACAIKYIKAKKDAKTASEKKKTAKLDRSYLRKRKESLKTQSDWTKEAQAEFNRFIRARDYQQPCISCGTRNNVQYHAGHYLSTGANPELRFIEDNCHKQCSSCNNHLSGNLRGPPRQHC